jgi:hypothetical protein
VKSNRLIGRAGDEDLRRHIGGAGFGHEVELGNHPAGEGDPPAAEIERCVRTLSRPRRGPTAVESRRRERAADAQRAAELGIDATAAHEDAGRRRNGQSERRIEGRRGAATAPLGLLRLASSSEPMQRRCRGHGHA